MLAPADYGAEALFDKETRALMEKITFSHGGKEYDEKYPDGIPTSIVITDTNGTHTCRSCGCCPFQTDESCFCVQARSMTLAS